jgi:2-succinyl-5-enolpyruvyl-6-hydroxy-3-cyclohexene-1-carboxylate synthase
MFMEQGKNINILWGCLIIEELIKNGIDYFCISPGSRSTPLTYSVATNSKARSTIFFDERSAAYHALGYARATGLPAVLLCTSGTAAANYFPAVIEAAQSNIPLLILTADRPPELRETGANQTIDQVKLFQNYVRWYYDLPCPTEEIEPEMVTANMSYAVNKTCMALFSGPVHINCMFREPLAPGAPQASAGYQSKCNTLLKRPSPHTIFAKPAILPNTDDISGLADVLNNSDKGIIVLGELPLSINKGLVIQLIEKLKWPVFPDILSGFRFSLSSDYIIRYYDQLLLSVKLQRELRQCTILHIGGRITSKRYLTKLTLNKPKAYIAISEQGERYDPVFCVGKRYYSEIAIILEKVLPQIHERKNASLVEKFINYQQKVSDILKNRLQMKAGIDEISVAQIISRLLPKAHGLYLGNSMPIRDMDMYAGTGADIYISANRGASGIDGTVSSAAGFALGLGKPVTAVLGDIAFLHDINTLSVIKEIELPIQLVVVNNGGGAIFSFLPIVKEQRVFERFFAAGHTITFERAADLFTIAYMQPKTNHAFQECYRQSLKRKKPVLIEIRTNRQQNYQIHQDLQQQITAAI